MHSIAMGKIFPSARKGILSLLPKKSKDFLNLAHWRPISLLCVDYKIYSKVLSNRLKDTLPTVISTDQSGFMAGRSVTDNIRRVLDVMEYTKINNIAALIISIDFQKAFDRVDYDALFRCMEYFGYRA